MAGAQKEPKGSRPPTTSTTMRAGRSASASATASERSRARAPSRTGRSASAPVREASEERRDDRPRRRRRAMKTAAMAAALQPAASSSSGTSTREHAEEERGQDHQPERPEHDAASAPRRRARRPAAARPRRRASRRAQSGGRPTARRPRRTQGGGPQASATAPSAGPSRAPKTAEPIAAPSISPRRSAASPPTSHERRRPRRARCSPPGRTGRGRATRRPRRSRRRGSRRHARPGRRGGLLGPEARGGQPPGSANRTGARRVRAQSEPGAAFERPNRRVAGKERHERREQHRAGEHDGADEQQEAAHHADDARRGSIRRADTLGVDEAGVLGRRASSSAACAASWPSPRSARAGSGRLGAAEGPDRSRRERRRHGGARGGGGDGLEARLVEKLGDVRYVYTGDGERIFKVVSFFLLRYSAAASATSRPSTRTRSTDARWLPLAERPSSSPTRRARVAERARTSLARRLYDAGASVSARRLCVRPQLLLAARRRPAAQPAQDGDHPARRQVVEVPEGDGRAGARRTALRAARAHLRRGHRQGRGQAARRCSPREIEHDNPEIRAPRTWPLPRPALQPRRDRGDTVTVIHFSEIVGS